MKYMLTSVVFILPVRGDCYVRSLSAMSARAFSSYPFAGIVTFPTLRTGALTMIFHLTRSRGLLPCSGTPHRGTPFFILPVRGDCYITYSLEVLITDFHLTRSRGLLPFTVAVDRNYKSFSSYPFAGIVTKKRLQFTVLIIFHLTRSRGLLLLAAFDGWPPLLFILPVRGDCY